MTRARTCLLTLLLALTLPAALAAATPEEQRAAAEAEMSKMLEGRPSPANMRSRRKRWLGPARN